MGWCWKVAVLRRRIHDVSIMFAFFWVNVLAHVNTRSKWITSHLNSGPEIFKCPKAVVFYIFQDYSIDEEAALQAALALSLAENWQQSHHHQPFTNSTLTAQLLSLCGSEGIMKPDSHSLLVAFQDKSSLEVTFVLHFHLMIWKENKLWVRNGSSDCIEISYKTHHTLTLKIHTLETVHPSGPPQHEGLQPWKNVSLKHPEACWLISGSGLGTLVPLFGHPEYCHSLWVTWTMVSLRTSEQGHRMVWTDQARTGNFFFSFK